MKRKLQRTAVAAFVTNGHANTEICERLADVIQAATWQPDVMREILGTRDDARLVVRRQPHCLRFIELGILERGDGSPLELSFQGELRREQRTAADAMLRHETGVLAATTAFGKTVVAAWLIAKRGVNVLVLVHPGDSPSERAVREIVDTYKTRFEQEAVLRVTTPACASL